MTTNPTNDCDEERAAIERDLADRSDEYDAGILAAGTSNGPIDQDAWRAVQEKARQVRELQSQLDSVAEGDDKETTAPLT